MHHRVSSHARKTFLATCAAAADAGVTRSAAQSRAACYCCCSTVHFSTSSLEARRRRALVGPLRSIISWWCKRAVKLQRHLRSDLEFLRPRQSVRSACAAVQYCYHAGLLELKLQLLLHWAAQYRAVTQLQDLPGHTPHSCLLSTFQSTVARIRDARYLWLRDVHASSILRS
ncbi:hypothetical protein MRB53_039012 [Persea americana]|nr:hypothetical protein MRB53_039012 [Persea americana]